MSPSPCPIDPSEWYGRLQKAYMARPDESLLDELTDIGRLMAVTGFPVESIVEIHTEMVAAEMALVDGHAMAALMRNAAICLSELLVAWRIAAEGMGVLGSGDGAGHLPPRFFWFGSCGELAPAGVQQDECSEATTTLDRLFCSLSGAERIGDIKTAIVNRRILSFEFFSSGGDRRMRAVICPFRDGSGIVGINDVTAQRADEQRLRLAATVFNTTQEGIVITDVDGRIVAINPAFCTITGYDEGELVSQNPRILKSGRHDDNFYRRLFETIAADGTWQGEIWNRRKNGEIYPQWLTVSAVRDGHGTITNYVGTFIDITRTKESESRLERLANYDALTDLPTRRLLKSRLRHAIDLAKREGTRGAVLFLDLDRFKDVNDSLGHTAGDELLQLVAKRFQARLRESDTLSRMGGDEFIIVLENLREPQYAAAVAQALIDELREPFTLSGARELYIGASIGISIFPDDCSEPGPLISNADAAMYQAKKAGRNTFRFYTESLTRAANMRVDIEGALRRALERDEFLLHYQPLVNSDSRQVVGIEALVRWERPGVGLIAPMQFIPLAEETGLILPIGEWVARTACAQMKCWLDAGWNLETIAINLSALQFRQDSIPGTIKKILDATGLPARHLELEITESVLMESAENVEAKLHTLKEIGVHLTIDDFGTGYSSLAYLKRFPIDKLKIDRGFVKNIPVDPADMKIVSAVVALANNLNLDVLAEGVETEAQLGFLRHIGCQLCQGYLFSKPLLASDLAGQFNRRRDAY